MAEREEQGSGMPAVGVAGLGYALPARADGMIYARPIIVTSVESTRQLVTGHVFIEPNDITPASVNVKGIGAFHLFVTDAKMGNPAEPNTVHWLAKNYMGRSDGPGLTPVGSTEVTESVSSGQESSPQAAPEPVQETWQRLGFASKQAWKSAGRPE
jgi:hypothetical protein